LTITAERAEFAEKQQEISSAFSVVSAVNVVFRY